MAGTIADTGPAQPGRNGAGLMTHTAGRLRLFPGRVRLPECGPAGTPAARARGLPGRGRRQVPPPPSGRRAKCAPSARSAGFCLGRRCRFCLLGGGAAVRLLDGCAVGQGGHRGRRPRWRCWRPAPSSRGWAARPARPAAPGRKPPLRSGCSAALRPVGCGPPLKRASPVASCRPSPPLRGRPCEFGEA